MIKAPSRSTHLVAWRHPSDEVRNPQVLEFPQRNPPSEDVPNGFDNLPEIIREAFLCDLREGRTNLWGWSYEEVRTALNVYRALRESNCEKSSLEVSPIETI